jgi:hypothetical protein
MLYVNTPVLLDRDDGVAFTGGCVYGFNRFRSSCSISNNLTRNLQVDK